MSVFAGFGMAPVGAPVVLVLASGRGERFLASGGQVHKLKALLDGKAVLQHTLDAVRASGLAWHLEDAGHPGMGDSIAAAVRATPQAAGWLVLPGDLPLVMPDTLRQVAEALRASPVVVPVCQGQRGHPVGFARACGPALAGLEGDKGAAAVVRAHGVQNTLRELPVADLGCITDVDTLAALQAAGQLLATRKAGHGGGGLP